MIDYDLINQMILNHAMNPQDMIDSLFNKLFLTISDLQAPIHKELYDKWMKQYIETILRCETFTYMIPLIPIFFEFIGECIDEIKDDVRNKYCNI